MNRVVITGIGAVTPIGNDVKTMWQNMMDKKHGIAPITHFDADGFETTIAAEVKDFDASAYMSRKDVMRFDPFTIFGVNAAGQALDDSGILGKVDPERMGVVFSSGVGGIITLEKGERALLDKGPARVPSFSIPAMIANMTSAVIAIKFKCHGSCMSLATACASSTNAIGEAYRMIKHGYADVMVAGGSDAAITPIGVASFNACKALSKSKDPDRASIPFDAERNGFVIGEGAGALVLESYEHAVNRDAEMYGEICGYGSTCDAFNVVAPSPDAYHASRAIEMSLDGVEREGRSIYVNAHGTSTKRNDEMETLAIKRVFGEEEAYNIKLSSTKSMMGHLLGGAGAVESIVCLLALREGLIPPTIGYKKADPMCDLDICANEVTRMKVDLALNTSFGFGGHNACLTFKGIE